jgi:CRP-like cAMP-binding protein
MEELDFTKPQPPAAAPPSAAPAAPPKAPASAFYDPVIAGKVFRAFGKAERFAAGATLFEEDQKAAAGGFFSRGSAARMYFVEQGQVALVAGGRPLDTVGAGEVIGEMAVISGQPRSATAVARTDCVAHSMGAEELKGALARMPEFAMMLMSVIFDRLRLATARLAARRVPMAARIDEPPVFTPDLLQQLEQALPRTACARFWPESVIMREGQTGTCLYVVREGTVAIAVGGKVVAIVNPGSTFGEMALVDQSPRSASAIAQTECELLAIDRASLAAAIRAQPAIAMAMLRAFAGRLRHANAQVG